MKLATASLLALLLSALVAPAAHAVEPGGPYVGVDGKEHHFFAPPAGVPIWVSQSNNTRYGTYFFRNPYPMPGWSDYALDSTGRKLCMTDSGVPLGEFVRQNHGVMVADDYEGYLWMKQANSDGGFVNRWEALTGKPFLCMPETPPAPPPLPPAPTVTNRPGHSLNVGQSGSAIGVGTLSSAKAAAQGEAAFDLESFCSAPAHDGKPRSNNWIRSCLASGPRN